jgi:hypothetical protein
MLRSLKLAHMLLPPPFLPYGTPKRRNPKWGRKILLDDHELLVKKLPRLYRRGRGWVLGMLLVGIARAAVA